MPKHHSSIPPAILSFVRKSNSTESGDQHDDDRALLLPSSGSSFNLAGDSELILPKSTSHHSAASRASSKSSRGANSNASSNSSGNSGRHKYQHQHHRGSSDGGGGGGGGAGKGKRKKRSSPKQREHNESFPSGREKRANTHNFPSKSITSSLPSGQDSDGYLVGYDTAADPRALSPIHSSSFHSEHSNSNNSAQPKEGEVTEIDWSTRSSRSRSRSRGRNTRTLEKCPSINTVHSGQSYKSRKSSSSNINSGSGSPQNNNFQNRSSNDKHRSSGLHHRRRSTKLKKEEKRREWVKRWRRRRLLGTVLLTFVYFLLGAYTLLITVGPLYLHFWDPDFWCPFYHDEHWEEVHQQQQQQQMQQQQHHSGYALNIDQLQQSRQQHQQQGVGNEHQSRRRLSSNGVEFASTTQNLKKVEMDLLRKTSKDVHSDKNNDGSDNNNNQNIDHSDSQQQEESPYENPDYDDTPCHITRIPLLFYLTLEECDLSRRMAASVLFGGFIGYERRAADRPAGIRTMALVALGSCFFTISSQLAFRDSPMTWDSSRVTAAIPSGVGFLGAGLIWKGSLSDGSGGEVHQVHGITTAASVWLAAAVGVGAGGALYAVAAYSTALVILVLRFGPRLYLQTDRGFDHDEEEDEDDEEEEEEDLDNESVNNNKLYGNIPKDRVVTQTTQKSGITHRNNYEMHEITGQSTKDTAIMKNKTAGYGATDIEQNMVAHILQEDQRRQIERMNRIDGNDNNSSGNPVLSWLTKFVPGKERQQPLNPYQEISRDREVMRMMKKKKSMSRMSSRPSFCT